MQQQPSLPAAALGRRSPSYAWTIVTACALMIGITYGLIYSYSVFFKPLAATFAWDRATTSLIYSLAVIIRGACAIGTGWLSDRYGPRRVMVLCGLLMAAGFLLCARVTTLWQFFLAYAVLEAAGMSGIFGIGTALTAQWFRRQRGLALGIVASGSGLGTFLIVPGSERLINAVGWSQAYTVIGIAAGVLMVIGALFLRRPPALPPVLDPEKPAEPGEATVGQALRNPRLYLIMMSFTFFFFGTQIVMVHLVNLATDRGIDSLVAATFMSIIGAASIAGRLSTGIISDRYGIFTSLFLTCGALIASFVLLLYTRSVWSFCLFAVLFSFPYGGEVTQIPLVIGRYFGTKAMATLMGAVIFIIGIGGAAGSWTAGRLYDLTGSYDWACITGALMAAVSVAAVALLKRYDRPKAAG